MKHDIQADTATVHDLVAVAEILVEHRGEDNPITSGEIADRTGLDSLDSTPRTRGVIRKLTREFGLPIAASNKGYYFIENRGEAREYLDHLKGRRRGIEQRETAVQSAVDRRGMARTESQARSWVQDLRGQLVESTEEET